MFRYTVEREPNGLLICLYPLATEHVTVLLSGCTFLRFPCARPITLRCMKNLDSEDVVLYADCYNATERRLK